LVDFDRFWVIFDRFFGDFGGFWAIFGGFPVFRGIRMESVGKKWGKNE
jgi:hypothetical protein